MNAMPLPILSTCPDPRARAPWVSQGNRRPHTRLHLAPPGLQGAVIAVLCRDTRGFALNDAQRLTHFPATPTVNLTWFQDVEAGRIEQTDSGLIWRPFNSALVLSGSHSYPSTCWAQTSGRAGMICFEAHAAQALFDIELSAIQDVIVDAKALLGDEWHALFDELLASDSDEAALAALQHHLTTRWRVVNRASPILPSLREAGRYWVKRLAWQAHEWRRSHSPRHVERRIKAYSGRSLREWQALVKTESVFFNARAQSEAGHALDWAAIAHDEGFADQAHLSRAVKRSTGFSPSEFARRFKEDESFWVYRLWV
ncbi:AraC family transcriptional regulator [Paraburkholderia sp. Ac-20336]|uniref:helix-turn-helix domain-containing protein n=1 Tax=Burkholderiaceae TaxID=119060 RepID=UPI00141DE111|nr:helix-turn-helix domain-containing protein [Burkholderia sp. Ax-1724]MBN3801871.1 AraC family transcriptional regulator [Paraburkholderia sp. Ac-20336]MBN3846220.1 AraC family transcriptional regulator [Paraburkholderia sp. Ac-20342]NIF55493.1 AraC family transcriptional regulator [Burkholderia sp. Ax-1724]NIF81341.1 AraC family transcriptional regulator [Paraburkholderia sp. Cy-641]